MSNYKLTVTLCITLLSNFVLLLFIIVKSSPTSHLFGHYINQTLVHLDRDRVSLRDLLQWYGLSSSAQDVNGRHVEKQENFRRFLEDNLIQLLLSDPLISNVFNARDPGLSSWREDKQTEDSGRRDRRSVKNNETSSNSEQPAATSNSEQPAATSNSEQPGAKNSNKQVVAIDSRNVQEIFSKLISDKKPKFKSPISTFLIPALMQFENTVTKKIESLRELVVSYDLRLEVLEKAMLSTSDTGHVEVQSDDLNNKSDLENPKEIIRLEELLPVANGSTLTEMKVSEDGSGELEGTTKYKVTSSTHKPTEIFSWKVPEYYEIFRQLTGVEQKVLALENYNMMSDSELTRVRSEVIKMDDRVTELDRRNRNLQVRMSMHAVKLSELELFKNKAEATIQTSQDSYGRINTRLEAFKDRLTELRNELRGVTSQFSRHDQIANELRAADSYKAHDIQEIRKNIFGLEGRLTSLYTSLDQNIQMMQADIKSVVDRLCSSKQISC
ncbi:hypothetical protein BgiMline_018548 [Biomphalaria glabrata]